MSDLNLSPQEQNIVDYHNGSMSSGRVGRDDQGRPMTVYSTGIMIERGPHKGKFVSVPGWVPEVNPDRPLTEREAFEHWEDEINKGTWPFYGSGEELNNRSQDMHRIMDMDADIINQNMGQDGKQSIHVTPEEAQIVEQIEGRMQRPRGPVQDFKWADVRHLYPVGASKAQIELGGPMRTSGLAYVDNKMGLSADMRGNKTPEHLQRQHDDIRSYMASEMSKNAIESYRASLPREVQDRMSGEVMIEQGRDGMYSLILGDDATGYTELSYGTDEQSYFDALSDAKRAFGHMGETGDAAINAGFLGRVGSAGLYGRRQRKDLQEEMMHNYNEARRYMEVDRSLAAEALQSADMIGDEVKRRDQKPETNAHPYTDRVLRRDARRRASKMMME